MIDIDAADETDTLLVGGLRCQSINIDLDGSNTGYGKRKKEVLHVELDEKKRKILAGRSAGKNLSTTLAKTDCEQNNPDHCTDHLDSFPH